MAAVPHQIASLAGVVLTPVAATAGPDTIAPGDSVILLVQNGSGGAVTVTVTIPGSTEYGQAQPDVTSVSIPAAGLAAIGPFPHAIADQTDDLVDVDVSSPTSVNLYAIRV
ncbi:hypothetical protein [Streptomyces sp.]|uniref:hypothetical protein n=1 Tax=Streptomyces sp. TaxID=1931 RepID=UPI002F93A8E9